jgi:DNA repair protein RadC
VQPEFYPSSSEQPNNDDLEHQTLWDTDSTHHYCAADMTQFTLRVKDLPVSERPRDRLIQQGVTTLSISELLSILLGTGQGAGKLSAVGLAQHLLQTLSDRSRRSTGQLRDITIEELMTVSGIGPAKAATIVAAIELGKRVYFPPPSDHPVMMTPRSPPLPSRKI